MDLAGRAGLALPLVIQAFALPLLYGEHHASCLGLRCSSEPLERHAKTPGDCLAHDALERMGVAWKDRLPGDPADLLAWLIGQEQPALLDLLAYLAALTVDAVEAKGKPRRAPVEELAQALALDMRDHWRPTMDGFWQRLTKPGLLAAMSEAKVTAAGPLESVKKAEAAGMVAKAMQDSDWLPEPLREMAA